MKKPHMPTITTSCGTFPGKRLKGIKEYSRLYHYTRLENFRLIWENKSLKFSEIKSVNDINEYRRKISAPYPRNGNISNAAIRELLEKVNNSLFEYKQISLTKDYDTYIRGCMSPMMWGHYGNKGSGVCIELAYDKLNLPKQFTLDDSPVDINETINNSNREILRATEEDIQSLFPESASSTFFDPCDDSLVHGSVIYEQVLPYQLKFPSFSYLTDPPICEAFIRGEVWNIFFKKTTDWKGENEYRIISKYQEYLKIDDAISAIYVTSHKSDTCKEVENIVKDEVPVYFFHYQNGRYAVPIISEVKKYRESLTPVIKSYLI